MPDIYAQQAVFNKGELSPKLHARVDSDLFAAGLTECRNFHVLVQGGVAKRSGTRYCGRGLRDQQTGYSHFIPFIFSDTQAYVLEFGNNTLGFIRDGGFVFNGQNRYQISTPYPVAALDALQFVQSADILYITHPDYPIYKLIRSAETSWSLTQFTPKNGPWMDVNIKDNILTPTGNGRPSSSSSSSVYNTDSPTNQATGLVHAITLTSPSACNGYTIQTIVNVNGDDIPLTDIPLTSPAKWNFLGSKDGINWVQLDSRLGQKDWGQGEMRTFTFENDVAYQQYQLIIDSWNGSLKGCRISSVNLSLKNRPGTVSFANTTGINNGAGLSSGDVGRQIRTLGSDGFWNIFTIQSVSSNRTASGVWEGFWQWGIGILFGQELPYTSTWQLGAFSKASGYPKACTLFQQRLCFAGTKQQPRTVFMSESADYEDFSIPDPLTDKAPITVTLAGKRFDAVDWIEEVEDLLMVGTSDSIVSLGGTENNVISPTNLRQRKHTGFGSANNTHPARIGATILFIGNHNKTVHELIYSGQANGYDAPNLSLLSDHLYTLGVDDIAFAQTPLDTAYIPANDGSLIAVTYESAQKVIGHAKFTTRNGLIKKICVIPEGNRDALYMLVERTISGAPRQYVERLEAAFDYGTDSSAWFLDCALRYQGPATNVITGLGHLEGQSVQIYTPTGASLEVPAAEAFDSDPSITFTVTNGQIVLPGYVTDIIVGLQLDAKIKLLQHAVQTSDGSSYGRASNTDGVIVALLNSRAIWVRANDQIAPEPLTLRRGNDPMNVYPPLFTGSVSVPMDSSWTIDDRIEFISNTPHPATILSVTTMVDREPGLARQQGG
jgi:hypothetical protein